MQIKLLKRIFTVSLIVSSLIGVNSTAVYAKSFSNTTSTISAKEEVSTNLISYNGQTLNPYWGLGKNQTEYISNDRPYNWYIDQGDTGYASDNNCGPSSVTMALQWRDEDFDKTAADARDTYPKDGGWWYTDDVKNYLRLNGAKYSENRLSEKLLKNTLSQGNIAILCIDTTYIPYNSNSEQRVGRFYNYKGGHFIVVKGYRVVDGKTYFETYDSNNWGERYNDDQEKGKNRYYLSKDLMNAAAHNYNYAIVIYP
ncbi:C39 family peptidase [uncultured Clostridium sp.]|uniref:C39 family peptidase n=1 Tax=uncultured Clostridium sp. TaxID=59620 RepID=UPI0028E99143|nr:C39 family peptidase [uncultured Clostridium sp.]